MTEVLLNWTLRQELSVSEFNDIAWSTDRVFKQTLDRINELKINNKVLNYYNDIDEISDINSNVIKIINSYKPDLRITI